MNTVSKAWPPVRWWKRDRFFIQIIPSLKNFPAMKREPQCLHLPMELEMMFFTMGFGSTSPASQSAAVTTDFGPSSSSWKRQKKTCRFIVYWSAAQTCGMSALSFKCVQNSGFIKILSRCKSSAGYHRTCGTDLIPAHSKVKTRPFALRCGWQCRAPRQKRRSFRTPHSA